MYYFGRIIGAFFNQFFRWLFWNKTGQKFLFSILIVFIFFCFIKLGEVSAVEEVTDINYEVRSYYDSVCNDAISRIESNWNNISDNLKNIILNDATYKLYFYYGSLDGSSYENARPLTSNNLNIIYFNNNLSPASQTLLNYDYLGVTGYTMYKISNRSTYTLTGTTSNSSVNNVSVPLFVFTYKNANWTDYILAKKNNDIETITALLEDIKESNANIEDALTNTEATSETDSFVNVDTSSTDSISSTAVDNVASSVLSNLENKVNNYNPSTDYSFVWNIMGTTITFHSNMIYNLIKDTFLYDLIQMLWYFITGHYAFAFLSNLIHSIKDGSILDGFHPNEVISKEVL